MGLPVSFEFFPPKTPEGVEKLRAVRQQLYPLKPEFCSVTYGAGGSTQEGTFNTVRDILAESVPAASHFSCIGATKDSVREQLATLKSMGVKRLVALRGDLPSGYGAGGEFHYASDLVAFIRSESGDDFHIEVAAVSGGASAGEVARVRLECLRDQGARWRSLGHHPVLLQTATLTSVSWTTPTSSVPTCRWCPASWPITSSTQLMRFSDASGAEIPRWIRLRLQAFGDDTASIKAFGLDVVTDLCDQLRNGGVPALHFYTMNQSAATLEIAKRLQLS